MSSKLSGEAARRRRRAVNHVKEGLRELSVQLAVLNRQVGARIELKESDFVCLDLINRLGPLSPGQLAAAAGLHPATLTGVIDRLERGGWVMRERDSGDRRGVVIRALRDRNSELLGHFKGMNAAMDEACKDYSEAELALVTDFLHRASAAGREAAATLAEG